MTRSAELPGVEQRRLGQFWTPPRIARWMAGWAVQPGARSVLDPAVGTGVLLQPLLDHPGLAAGATVTGVDVDPGVLTAARAALAPAAWPVVLEAADFLALDDDRRFDAIVANPPYVRHRALVERAALYSRIERELGIRLNRFTNSYALFLLQIARRLSPGGRAAILLPVDWLNANFGAPIKRFLLREDLLHAVLVFGKRTLIFPDANVAACLVLLEARGARPRQVMFARVPEETDLVALEAMPPERVALVAPEQLDPEHKWLALVPPEREPPAVVVRREQVPLGELAQVRRGIATGANEFFTLTAAERARLGLEAETRPCVVKAPHAPWLEFTAADFAALATGATRTYVLDLGTALSAAAQAYVAQGAQQGIDQRYLPRMRRPWYTTEQRDVAPLWVTTFSRRGFRFVVNLAGVANLTAFHGITPHAADAEWLAVLAAWLNSAPGRASLAGQQRSYGSGLAKLEPRDVAALAVPDPERLRATERAEIAALWAERCRAERAGEHGFAAEIDRLWATR